MKLAPRQSQIVELFAQGVRGADIARQLQISGKTVSATKSQIKVKLGMETEQDWQSFLAARTAA